MKRKRVWLWLTVTLLLTMATFALWRWFPREPLLLERATRIADTKAWYGGGRFNNSIGIHWLSDHELLYSKFEGPQHEQRVTYRRDLPTGQETLLPGLTKSRDDLSSEVVDDQKVSPDGNWFLCSARWGDCLLAAVNGTRHFTYSSQDSEDYRQFFWAADSRYWLENYVNGGVSHALQLHDTLSPKSGISLSIKGRETLIGHMEAMISPQMAIAVQIPEEGEDAPPSTQHCATVTLFALTDNKPPIMECRVALPGQTHYGDFKVSPKGDRIAWLFVRTANSYPDWLLRLHLPLQNKAHVHEELWVSNLNGKRMHKIGYFSLLQDASEEYSDTDPIRNLQWLPGGHRLSFELNDTLYTVPAE